MLPLLKNLRCFPWIIPLPPAECAGEYVKILWYSAVPVSYHTFLQDSFLGLRQFLLALFHGFTVMYE